MEASFKSAATGLRRVLGVGSGVDAEATKEVSDIRRSRLSCVAGLAGTWKALGPGGVLLAVVVALVAGTVPDMNKPGIPKDWVFVGAVVVLLAVACLKIVAGSSGLLGVMAI